MQHLPNDQLGFPREAPLPRFSTRARPSSDRGADDHRRPRSRSLCGRTPTDPAPEWPTCASGTVNTQWGPLTAFDHDLIVRVRRPAVGAARRGEGDGALQERHRQGRGGPRWAARGHAIRELACGSSRRSRPNAVWRCPTSRTRSSRAFSAGTRSGRGTSTGRLGEPSGSAHGARSSRPSGRCGTRPATPSCVSWRRTPTRPCSTTSRCWRRPAGRLRRHRQRHDQTVGVTRAGAVSRPARRHPTVRMRLTDSPSLAKCRCRQRPSWVSPGGLFAPHDRLDPRRPGDRRHDSRAPSTPSWSYALDLITEER